LKFLPIPLPGAMLVEPEPAADERGFFARIFCREEFAAYGLASDYAQHSISYNARRGTLRGMHYQRPPHEEAKVIRCTAGAVFDVLVDLRRDSPTQARWWGTELSARNRRMVYAPPGLAHGFLTLEDESEVGYLISAAHSAEASAGVRWDDPAFAIRWPAPVLVMSARDREFPDWRP
jgi:dTDP-4-dehydrorhamnose 3,5-epimerase